MSKYEQLWVFIAQRADDSFSLAFDNIREITGFTIDHSFLRHKKDLDSYGYKVVKISMKEQTVYFKKI